MNKPNPASYGLTQADLDSIIEFNENSSRIPGLQWLDKLLGNIPELLGGLLFWTVLWPFFIIGVILSPITKLIWTVKHPKEDAFHKYAAECEEYLRHQGSYWHGLSGGDFEAQLAVLYRRLGYEVTQTKGSGDEGVDLVIKKNESVGLVQCKRWNKPAGVSVLRDMLGTLISKRADFAVVACTGGFSQPALRFARENSIKLLNLEDILRMADQTTARRG